MNTTTFPKKLTGEVKSLIMRAVYEALSDPDFGLELSERAKRRLRKARISRGKTTPFSEIKKQFS